MSNQNILHTQERYYSPHHLLWRIASCASDEAIQNPEGRTINILKAIIFAAIGTESFINALGFRTQNDWGIFEKHPTFKKIEIMCDYFNLSFSKDTYPWTNINHLLHLRNDIAHGKPENLFKKNVFPEKNLEKKLFDTPLSKLEEQLTLGISKNAVKATADMRERFRSVVPPEIAYEIFQDSWSGSISITP